MFLLGFCLHIYTLFYCVFRLFFDSFFFFFKHKTAYEMLISDWSSDVCSSDLLSNLAEWVPDWRFKPVLVGGKAVPARATMTVRMLARPSGEDMFEVSIAGTSFGLDGWRPTDNVQRLEMKPPHYPRDVVRGGGQGTAYLVFKVGRGSEAGEVVVARKSVV